MFNWLGQDLTGKACLDLFAGTGAFGFEALSRNAKSVVMVEYSAFAYKSLLQNQTLLNAQNCQIHQIDALNFLNQHALDAQKMDIIFCDPPYNKDWLGKLFPLLNQHLASDGVLYVEAEYEVLDNEIWQVIKKNKAGNVYYHLLKSV